MKKFNNLRIETLEEKLKTSNPPFDPDPPKKNPSAVAGKYGQGYSTAKHLAQRGMAQGPKKIAEEISKSEVEHHHDEWMNSEHRPYQSDAGNDPKIHKQALRYLSTTDVPKEKHEELAMHIADKFHGSGINEAYNPNSVAAQHRRSIEASVEKHLKDKASSGNKAAQTRLDALAKQKERMRNDFNRRMEEENLDEISTKTLAKAAKSASDPDSDYYYGKSHDPQKFADHAKKTKDAKSAAAVQGAADAKSHYARPGHTLGSYDKLANRTPARVTSTGKANKQDVKTLKGNIQRNEKVEQLTKESTDDIETTRQFRNAIAGVKARNAIDKAKDGPGAKYYADGAKVTPQETARRAAEAEATAKTSKTLKGNIQRNEEVTTTHEDPLVVVKDAEGNIHTHANLKSVVNPIHGINVSHHAIHTGMPIEVVDRDGKKLTVQKSMHHDSEVAKDSASAVEEEEENKKYTHIVKHIKTGNVVGKYTSLKAATRAADKKDNAYGGYAHQVDYIREAKEKTEYDYEGDMARGQLQSIIMNAQRVHDMLEDNDNLPEWVQSKITLAEDYISTVSNYMASEIDEMHLSFGKPNKPLAPVSAKLSDMKKYFAGTDKDQMKQKITGKKFRDMSEYEAWMKSNKTKSAMQVASFQPKGETKLDELSKDTLRDYMVAGHKKFDSIRNNTDAASIAKKAKLDKGGKAAYAKRYPKPASTPAPKADPNSRGYEKGRYMGDSVEQDSKSQIDELKSTTYQSYVDTVADPKVASKRGNTQKGIPKSIKAIGGVTRAIGKQNFAARLASAASKNF